VKAETELPRGMVSGRFRRLLRRVGDEGLAVTVEHAERIIVAEMASDMDAATRRASELREALVGIGLTEHA
jgi:hypothetical protein